MREFFITNAGYWIDEFHLDGLRLDATHAILDDSPDHILAALCRHARQKAEGRSILLIAEDDSQDAIRVRSPSAEATGSMPSGTTTFITVPSWPSQADRKRTTPTFCGTPQELISAVKWGFLFQGQLSVWHKKPRGTSTYDLPGPGIHYLS